MTDFATWWSNEGSAMRPRPDEDVEEFAKRVTEIAWSNGEEVEREACALACEAIEIDQWSLYKGRPPYTGKELERASEYTQGMSDGAGQCHQAIRARAKP